MVMLCNVMLLCDVIVMLLLSLRHCDVMVMLCDVIVMVWLRYVIVIVNYCYDVIVLLV